jgi:tetratricopeptide (TPR) repeat protein
MMSSNDRAPRESRPPRPAGSSGHGGAQKGGGYKGKGPRKDGDPRRGDAPRNARAPRKDGDARTEKPIKKGPPAPEIPEEVVYGQLDRTVRARLRTLSKENAEDVGRHLIMAGNLMDTDPELAYRHAMVAASRGGRVDVVREAAALTAYATGRYAEALREFRTVRRLNGSSDHLPLMADCERGLGRPERAIALAQESEAATLSPGGRIELAIVVAGARADMGDKDAALVSLKRLTTTDPELRARIDEATASILRELGRDEEAAALEPAALPVTDTADDEDVIVYDTFEEEPGA